MGSRSTNTALGTCLPAPVSLKNVLNESSALPTALSLGIWPLGWIPCSKQYNSQQALPIWTPAWPTWIEIHSRWKHNTRRSLLKLEFVGKLRASVNLTYGYIEGLLFHKQSTNLLKSNILFIRNKRYLGNRVLTRCY